MKDPSGRDLNPRDLDNYITGHYGEDQFPNTKPIVKALTKAQLLDKLRFFTDDAPIFVETGGGTHPVLEVAVGSFGAVLFIGPPEDTE